MDQQKLHFLFCLCLKVDISIELLCFLNAPVLLPGIEEPLFKSPLCQTKGENSILVVWFVRIQKVELQMGKHKAIIPTSRRTTHHRGVFESSLIQLVPVGCLCSNVHIAWRPS
jgi:hypothetical protein